MKGVEINVTKCVVYLGVTFISGKNRGAHFNARLMKANMALSSVLAAKRRLGICGIKFECDVYRSMVLSSMMYCLLIHLPHANFKTLSSFHVTSLKKIFNLPNCFRDGLILIISKFTCLK